MYHFLCCSGFSSYSSLSGLLLPATRARIHPSVTNWPQFTSHSRCLLGHCKKDYARNLAKFWSNYCDCKKFVADLWETTTSIFNTNFSKKPFDNSIKNKLHLILDNFSCVLPLSSSSSKSKLFDLLKFYELHISAHDIWQCCQMLHFHMHYIYHSEIKFYGSIIFCQLTQNR